MKTEAKLLRICPALFILPLFGCSDEGKRFAHSDSVEKNTIPARSDSIVLTVSVGPGDDYKGSYLARLRVVAPGGESWSTDLANDVVRGHRFASYPIGDTLFLELYPFPDREGKAPYRIPFRMNESMIVDPKKVASVIDTNVLAIGVGADSIEAVGRQVFGVPWSYGDSLQAKRLNFKRYVVPL